MKIVAAALLALTSLVATTTLADARDHNRHHGPVMVVHPGHHGWHHGHDRWHHRSHWDRHHHHN